MPSVTEILETMEYGPAPEANDIVVKWLKDRKTFGHYIDGAFTRPGRTFAAKNPATGEVLAEVTQGTAGDVAHAVRAARAALPGWSRLPGHERAKWLYAIARNVQKRERFLSVLEVMDNGKPIREARDIDVPLVARHFYHHAGWAEMLAEEFPGAGPVGVCGQIIPWNFPLLMLAWKIGPALAAGCSVIVKPAEETPLTALRIAELAMEAGIPPGVFNVVPGTGPDVGEPIGRHMDIDAVSFTGSTETGRRFLRYAAESNLKEVTLEMGGKNPAVVLDDAENLDRVAAHIVNGAFWNMGENCSASSRLIVQRGVKDELLKRILAHAREWPVGDPLDPVNRVGALVSKAHYDKVCSYLGKGPKVLLGGKAEGGFVEPTILDIVDRDARQVREEIFGPVLSVLTVETFDQAVELANDTEYGLAASIFTANVKRALRGARAIRAGTVTVNSFGEGDITTPFGGFRQSGFGGRDNGIHAHDQYTQLKTIWVDLADDADEAVA